MNTDYNSLCKNTEKLQVLQYLCDNYQVCSTPANSKKNNLNSKNSKKFEIKLVDTSV